MTADRRIIHQSDTVRVIAMDMGGTDVVVTFNPDGFGFTGNRFWEDAVLEGMSVTGVGIVRAPLADRYQADEISAGIEAANRFIAGRCVIAIGHGMGGYGALRFGKALSASVALAFAPRWTPHAAEVESNPLAVKAGQLGARNFVFFDPRERSDAAHARYLGRLPDVYPIVMRLNDRQGAFIADEGGALADFISRARAPDVTPAELRNIVRRTRRESQIYNFAKTEALLKRSKSTAFLYRHLRNYSESELLLFAIVKDLHQKNVNAATARLEAIQNEDILSFDFFKYLAIFRNYKFTAGELRLAGLVGLKYGEILPYRIQAVETFINFKKPDLAQAELAAIAPLPGAAQYLEKIIALATARDALGAVSVFLEDAWAASPIPEPGKFATAMRITDMFLAKGARQEAFHQLRKLTPIYEENPNHLQAIAQRLSGIGEDTLAIELFTKLLKEKPNDLALERGLLKSMIALSRPEAIERLERFLKRDGATAGDWQFAAETFHQIGQNYRVGKYATTSLAMGGDVLQNRYLIAVTWLQMKNPAKSAAEIRKIPLDKIRDAWRFRQFAELASVSKDMALAAKIAQEYWRKNPTAPDAAMYCLNFLIRNEDLKQAAVVRDELFALLEAGRRLSRKEAARLAEICFKTFHSDTLEKRAIEIGLKMYPDDDTMKAAMAQQEARQRFMASHGGGTVKQAGPSTGLLGRLRRRFGG
jgi:tetratricopeptide (TPR) repeat protein